MLLDGSEQFRTVGGVLVGKPGVFKRPQLEDGPLKDLNDALHTLHLWAGRPSLSEMYTALSDEAKKKISRSTLHAALAGPALPRRDTIDALVEILGTRARSTTPEDQLLRFDTLWQRAALTDVTEESLLNLPLPLGAAGDVPFDLISLVRQQLDGQPEDSDRVFALLLLAALKPGETSERHDRTTDLFRFLVAEKFGQLRQPPPPLAAIGGADDDVIDAEIID
ncbi:hypothetical protein [Streptomyces sp. NBC_01244]|uniref:hypothetical protein n=1 Tax=Streptomyces sp. NBC_01244 TaxID=2903797 RepID=UPI002E12BCCB|nr:hypothetical protein OG247_41460 [Streptomyces sp. NBC_01244]